MKHLNDRASCPHCHRALNPRPYVMSRRATENVLATNTILWIVAAALVLLIVAQAH